MLDKLNSKLIKILNEHCTGANYKVIEIDEILPKMARFKLDKEGLLKNLEYLQEREFVDLKFAGDTELCLALLPKGRLHSEEIQSERKVKNAYFKLAVATGLVSAICAFLGSLLAHLIFK